MTEDISPLIKHYDVKFGTLGRGHQIPVERVLRLLPEIEKAGFLPYTTPGRSGVDAQFIPLYGCDGSAIAGVWFGFVRQDVRQDVRQNRGEIIAFEITDEEARSAHEEISKALNSVLSADGH